ncbi:protein dachsous-like [Oculina patagonica]
MNDSERTCIPWNVCRFRTKLWLWYVVLLWTTCVFDLHPCLTSASTVATFYISEGLPKGSVVGSLSHINFDIVSSITPDAAKGNLKVDPNTKIITTNVVLDRETVPNYVISLLDISTFVSYTVLVNVTDANDNIPKFSSDVYHLELYEEGSVQQRIKATDKDFGSNSTQKYTILSGNVGSVFKLTEFLDSNGGLCADLGLVQGKVLDREKRDSYLLNVSASDGGAPPKTGFTLLNITVLDINDHSPIFANKSYSASIDENSRIGTSILKVLATDNDIGMNGEVLYSIERGSHSDPDRIFSIHEKTGVIVNNALLDYEKKHVYNIFVRAKNPGVLGSSKYDEAAVAIHVVDINDNKPDIRVEFELGGSYQVSEDAGIGTSVARIYVSDKDSGKNGEVDVTLQGGNGHFSAKSDPNNNVDIIATAKKLDRERQATYTLKVVAKDRGQPQQTSQESFIINVGDINDNPPEFDQDVFTAVVSENATIGSSVVVTRAADKDTGLNAKLAYSISYVPQAFKTWFQINQTTGEIRTAAMLDREKVPRAKFFVTVTDLGVPPLSANCTVIVNITDANDNYPVFSRDIYFATVDENTANGTTVTQVYANDSDSGLNGIVRYSLEIKNIPFVIDPITGLVTTSGQIDFERQSLYMLNVVATDGGGRATISVLNISVIDENDNYPVISPLLYSVSLYENLTVGDVVATILAKDNDSGINSQLRFSISNGNSDDHFLIESSTGIITLNKALDRETKDFHRFEVQVTDGGGKKSKNSAVVRVTVLDVNDEPPVFEPSFYNFTIVENSDIYTVLGSVYASSKDLGTNADIYYSISGGDVHNVFKINSTGTIFTRSNIDHEKTPRLWLNIQAEDGGSPPLYGFANVSVTVIDLNDNSPSFTSSIIDVDILEDTSVGQVFYNVTAQDPDSGLFGQVSYTLLSNPNNTFELARDTGSLSLTRSIDFEGPKQYSIRVLAEDGGSPPLNATATFRLTVVDVNDHPPIFPNSSYSTHVGERTPAGTNILNVTASDADTGDNARISYTFQSGVDTALFGLRSNGWIYIKQELDREIQEIYRFTVVATDKGTPPKSSTADVTVYVDDVNDNNPKFTLQSYIFPVNENEPNRTFVGQVSASDKDAGSNAKIAYSFDPPSPASPVFVIDRDTGIIRTNEVLNREQKQSYSLMVKASDHGRDPRVAHAKVTVTVQDLNDNAPTFKKLSYEKAVSEDIGVGSSVITVQATDPDAGSNGMITYFAASTTSLFSINAQTGVITTAARLDREKNERHTLNIGASDQGNPPQSTVVFVTIHVLDVNDNPPRFVNNSFFVNVPEKQPVGSVVTTVTAKDIDAGNNGRVRYTIDQGNGGKVFEINATSGVITLRKPLDFERRSKYQLRIVARDQGQNSQSSFLYVTVYVLDSNDNRPTFDRNPVTVQLREGVPINYNVTTIKAHDYDSGQNSWIRYSVDSQSPGPPKFKVDPSTGTVQTIGEIDRESVDEYTLNIRATDQAFTESERLSSTITVFIIVDDVNDNKPAFVSPNYTFVMEDEPFGYPVITITAIDQDLGRNGRVKYRIVQGGSRNSFGKFSLEADTGLLRLQSALDYETTPKYVLNISATDEGSPPQSSYQLLTIYLVDVNDNAPQFRPSLFFGNVSENEPVGTPVMKISANDSDSGSNGALTYSIPRGKVIPKFAINSSSGVIYTNSTLDREEKDKYQLTVYATDNAFPFRVGTCAVTIRVLDKNDHAPIFKSARLNLTVFEDQAPSVFHTLTAQDSDIGENGRVRYVLKSGNEDNRFSIGEFSGALSTTTRLNREEKARYDLEIEASDVTSPFYTTTAYVTVFVGDVNDNSPKFTEDRYEVDIRELTKIDSVILTVTATDDDSGTNGDVVYSLSNDTFGVFRIDSKTGAIYTLQGFNYPVHKVFTFLCHATDRGVSPRRASVAVQVSIIDENNHAPEFEKIPYYKQISSVTPDAVLVTVSATDEDSSSITQMTYRFVNGTSPQYFHLESNTGQLRVKQGVTNIPNGAYILHILADDGGNLTGRGIVEIVVGSVTVNPPQFVNSTPVFVTLPENSPKNHEVTRVLASASLASASIVYSIVDGNSGNAFYINPQSGVVTVLNQAQLDYERLRYFRIHIIASLRSGSSRNDYLTLYVNLTDVNDNKPVFYPANISVQLTEDNALLSSSFSPRTVATLTTTDKDSRDNNKITYEIIAGNVNKKFSINQQSGVITTQGLIDRENQTFYDLVVKATDGGSPPKSSLSHVFVNIIDVNDNIPAFSGPYSVDVDEDLKVGSVVKRVTATDNDKNPNLVYSFSNGQNNQDVFHIERLTGDVTLVVSLDYERIKSYVLNITCSDGTYQSETTLSVNVKDVNDNAPKFLESSYQATLSEATDAGTSILRVSAEDADSGTNGQLTYKFVTSVDEFRINATSGVIYTAKKIETGVRESLLFVVVSATDHGIPHSTRFCHGADQNQPETTVQTWPRLATSSNLAIPNRSFRIGRRSGVIEVNKRGLDYETESNYLLGVEARDDSTNKSVVVEVNITITDVNDNPPVFDPTIYIEEVNEDVPIGTTLLRVNASDKDSGANGRVVFSILTGNDKQSFAIGSTSGEIWTVKNLDHESIKEHKLSVQARDEGLKPKTSLASVRIKVGDVNDNIPEFHIPHPEDVAVEENSPVGTSFYEVTAIDRDSGNNGAVKYSITGGSGWGLFVINSFSGMLSTNATFDYEARSRYLLEIKAEDAGSPRLENKINLTVYIKSVDESQPKFEKDSYKFDIPGNAEIGYVVGQVVATDEDGGEDGVVRYSFEFSSSDVFAINATSGIIFVNKSLEEVNSAARRRRSIELTEEESIRTRRVRREVTTVTLRIRADSGKAKSNVGLAWVEVGIDFACAGCSDHRK